MVIIIISIIFWFLAFNLFSFDVKQIIGKLSSVKEVDAEVIKKECFSDLVQGKFAALTGREKEHYIITFMCNDKKRKFNVPENTYDSYRIGDCGTLKYRGNIILVFNKF